MPNDIREYTLYGVKVIINNLLTETLTEKRTWKERLFSLPWKPFLKYKSITLPSSEIYMIGDKYIMHMETYKSLKKRITY